MYTRISIYLLVAALIISAIEFGPSVRQAIADARKRHQELNGRLGNTLFLQVNFLGRPRTKQADHLPDIVSLLQQGADLNSSSGPKSGTVFGGIVYAAADAPDWKGTLPLIGFLLDHGADPNRPQFDGQSVLDLAIDRPELAALLKAHGAIDPLYDRTANASAAELDDIREAAFRELLPKNNAPPPSEFADYFLAVSRNREPQAQDVKEEFLKRFADLRVPIKQRSDSTWLNGAVINKASKKNGEIIVVGDIRWIAENQVVVEASLIYGNVGANGFNLMLEKKNGKWAVINRKETWVS